MYSWEPAEVHRVPQRAAHYTGESKLVNTFFEVFFAGLNPALKGLRRNGAKGRSLSFFPGKYWLCRPGRS